MTYNFDLEALVDVEQQLGLAFAYFYLISAFTNRFYDQGYKDGYNHGQIHGLIEGRALGQEKGFEIWEELGFYEAFAKTWKGVYSKLGRGDDRAMNHANHLLELISQFPRVNPSPNSQEAVEMDISKLMGQIKSRYKALCSTLGVKSSLRARAAEQELDRDDGGDASTRSLRPKKPVWSLDDGAKSRGVEQGLSI